jgi:hypothetical protein
MNLPRQENTCPPIERQLRRSESIPQTRTDVARVRHPITAALNSELFSEPVVRHRGSAIDGEKPRPSKHCCPFCRSAFLNRSPFARFSAVHRA